MTATLPLFVALYVSSTAAATTPATGWVWTEAYAAQTVVAKVSIPCADVKNLPDGLHACDLAQSKAVLAKEADAIEQQCANSPSPTQCAMGAGAAYANTPGQQFFPVGNATCIGTGEPYKGAMFSAFRCVIEIDEESAQQSGDATAQGFLGYATVRVTVTGKTTFRWAIV